MGMIDDAKSAVTNTVNNVKSATRSIANDFAFGKAALRKAGGDDSPMTSSSGSTISTMKPDPDARKKADAGMRKMYPAKTASKVAK